MNKKKPMYLGLSGLAGTEKILYKYLKTTLNKNLFKVKAYSWRLLKRRRKRMVSKNIQLTQLIAAGKKKISLDHF